MANSEQCAFCNLEPERIINEGELFASFLSNPLLKIGHTLVIPKRHVELPTSLTGNEELAVLKEVRRIQSIMIGNAALFGGGCDEWQKYQPSVEDGGNQGTKLDHVHRHVVPREANDRLFMTPEPSQLDEFTFLSGKEAQDYYQQMIETLKVE